MCISFKQCNGFIFVLYLFFIDLIIHGINLILGALGCLILFELASVLDNIKLYWFIPYSCPIGNWGGEKITQVCT